jgi:hypothetical protein
MGPRSKTGVRQGAALERNTGESKSGQQISDTLDHQDVQRGRSTVRKELTGIRSLDSNSKKHEQRPTSTVKSVLSELHMNEVPSNTQIKPKLLRTGYGLASDRGSAH